MRYLGIDPGLSGALALIRNDGKVKLYDTPVKRIKVSGRKHQGRDYDLPACVSLLQHITTTSLGSKKKMIIMLEGVTARPITGVVANYSLGRSRALWEGMLAALGLEYQTVHPMVWSNEILGKRKRKNNKKGKDIRWAVKLFPQAKKFFKLKKDNDKADALLIAEYARRLHLGKTSRQKKAGNRSRT